MRVEGRDEGRGNEKRVKKGRKSAYTVEPRGRDSGWGYVCVA